jgi:hypothetical protein
MWSALASSRPEARENNRGFVSILERTTNDWEFAGRWAGEIASREILSLTTQMELACMFGVFSFALVS